MKKILVTGATGQIGTELVLKLRKLYGEVNVIASGVRQHPENPIVANGPYEILDVRNDLRFYDVASKYSVDTIIHLAAFLSATAEVKPIEAWDLNMNGLINGLEVAKSMEAMFFTPSSIGAFGMDTPKLMTPQVTIQRPNTMYGINKLAGELLCDYYHKKFGVDTRGLRLPGLISHMVKPGGGTTDYAVHIFYEALKSGQYTCYLKEDTFLDMMYMPDAINAIIQLLNADGKQLIHRNAYNVSAMSICPHDLYQEIKKHLPDFKMTYDIDDIKQGIADSWPDALNSQAAKEEWHFNPVYGLEEMTKDMLMKVKV